MSHVSGTIRLLLAGAMLLLIASPAAAVSKLWTNATADGLWMTAGNWSPAGVPGTTDDVSVGTQSGASGTNVVTLDSRQIHRRLQSGAISLLLALSNRHVAAQFLGQ